MGGEAGYHNIENKLRGKASDGVGLQIGNVSTNKIGFLGATPVTQLAAPTAATAMPSLDATSAASAVGSDFLGAGLSNISQVVLLIAVVSNVVVRVDEVTNVLSDLGLQA